MIAALAVIVIAVVAFAAAAPRRDGFAWGDWAENTSRENYDQRRRRLESGRRFSRFQAYRKPDPLGGFPDFNPHSALDGHDAEFGQVPVSDLGENPPLPWIEQLGAEGEHASPDPVYENFIGGAIPCADRGPCVDRFYGRIREGRQDARAAGARELALERERGIYEGFTATARQDALAADARERAYMRERDLYEGFSPDAPGACAQKRSLAAKAELNALRVAGGL